MHRRGVESGFPGEESSGKRYRPRPAAAATAGRGLRQVHGQLIRPRSPAAGCSRDGLDVKTAHGSSIQARAPQAVHPSPSKNLGNRLPAGAPRRADLGAYVDYQWRLVPWGGFCPRERNILLYRPLRLMVKARGRVQRSMFQLARGGWLSGNRGPVRDCLAGPAIWSPAAVLTCSGVSPIDRVVCLVRDSLGSAGLPTAGSSPAVALTRKTGSVVV